MRFAKQNLTFGCNYAVRDVCQRTAFYAYGIHFRNIVGYGAKRRHRTERLSCVVEVETGDNHSCSFVCQVVADINKSFVEELSLVNSNDIKSAGLFANLCRTRNRGRRYRQTVVGDNVVCTVSYVERGLKDHYALLCKFSAAQSSYKFFCFAREHASAYNLNASAVYRFTTFQCHCPFHFRAKKYQEKNLLVLKLRRLDSNERPPGYEPGELPTAPLRDVSYSVLNCRSFPNCDAKLRQKMDSTKFFKTKFYIFSKNM